MFVLFAFLLVSGASFAQDEKPQSEGTLMIVPRLDVEATRSHSDRSWSFDLGMTSLYTVFDGNLGDYFSFSFANHWFAFATSFEDTKNLYRNTWRADECNWVDWANVSLHLGNFSLTLGKDYIHFGTFEVDDYDFDAIPQVNSLFWHNYQVYQWGGSLGWTSSDENTNVVLQMTTDQWMEKPFSSKNLGDYAYTLYGSHATDDITVMGSISHCTLGWVGAFGVEAALNDIFTLTGQGYLSNTYCNASLQLKAGLGDHFEVFAKGGFDVGENELFVDGRGVFCGVGGFWYPLRNSKDLRIHAVYSYDDVLKETALSAGITYALNLKLF